MKKLLGIFVLIVLLSGMFATSNFAFSQVGPLAQDDFYSVDEDAVLTVDPIGVLLNDTNTDFDTFIAVIMNITGFGNLFLNENGSFTYEPNQNFADTDSFTYVANNGTHNSNEATVTISINPLNDAPVAEDDFAQTIQNVPILIDILENDSDVEDDSLSIFLEVDPDVTEGIVKVQDSQVLFTPLADFVGETSFSYMVSDGQDTSNIAKVTITVDQSPPPNTAPVAIDDSYSVDQDNVLTVNAASGVLGNDSDEDDDSLTANLEISVSNGSVTLNENGSFTYTPTEGFSGQDSFTYVTSDGIQVSNIATVNLTVNPVEDTGVSILDEIFEQIQTLFDRLLNLEEIIINIQEKTSSLEDEVTRLREENSALSAKVVELEDILVNGMPDHDLGDGVDNDADEDSGDSSSGSEDSSSDSSSSDDSEDSDSSE